MEHEYEYGTSGHEGNEALDEKQQRSVEIEEKKTPAQPFDKPHDFIAHAMARLQQNNQLSLEEMRQILVVVNVAMSIGGQHDNVSIQDVLK